MIECGFESEENLDAFEKPPKIFTVGLEKVETKIGKTGTIEGG